MSIEITSQLTPLVREWLIVNDRLERLEEEAKALRDTSSKASAAIKQMAGELLEVRGKVLAVEYGGDMVAVLIDYSGAPTSRFDMINELTEEL